MVQRYYRHALRPKGSFLGKDQDRSHFEYRRTGKTLKYGRSPDTPDVQEAEGVCPLGFLRFHASTGHSRRPAGVDSYMLAKTDAISISSHSWRISRTYPPTSLTTS